MTDTLPKNNHPKLKWWQKGALIGFGMAFIIGIFWQFFLFPAWSSGGDVVNVLIPGLIFFVLDLPVLPFYLIIGNFLGPILSFSSNVEILLIHFISWIIGGVFYAYIFRLIAKLSRKNKRQEFKVKKKLLILGKIFPTSPKSIFPKGSLKDLSKSIRLAINKNPKIIILTIAILAVAGVCYFYEIPQRIFTPQPSSESTPPPEIIQPLEPETIPPETIPPEKITPSPETDLPSPPTNLSCESGDGQVILSWNNPDIPNFFHIHIYRSTDNQQLGELVYDNVIVESLTDRGLTNSLLYYYTLRTVDTSGRESVSLPNYTFTCMGRPSLKISEYKIYKNEKYGYDMISSETPILKVVVFNDQNEDRRKDAEEQSLEAVYLDQYWNDEFFGKLMTPEDGVVNFFELPLYQKVTITPSKDGWLISNIDRYKYEFTLSEIPKTGITIYFGLSSTRPKIECNKTDFKMAFILLVQNIDEATEERLNTLNRIKEEFSYYFPQATRSLTSMDTDDDIYIMRTEESMCDPNCGDETTRVFLDRIAKKFYETHNDIYDFISIYTTFETPKINMHHTAVIQNIEGIAHSVFDNSENYGSENVLRGINFMRDIDSCSMMYGDSLSELGPMYGLLHETGHQWCCYVGDNFARGQNDAKLEIIQQNIHFYAGLQSACETRTPMGARKWVPNNGAFKQKLEERVEPWKYHPFQLYFMGLLPEEEYDVKFQIYDAGYNGEWNIENAVPYKQVDVRDIIEVAGERICIP